MTKSDKIKEILIEITGDKASLTSDDLALDGYLDSFSMVSVIMRLEEEFGIEISPEDLTPEYFASYDKICDFMNR